MVRISYPNEDACNEPSATGRELDIARMTRHFPPAMLAGSQAFGKGVLSNDVLDETLRELTILRVAHVSGSKYERYQHEHCARKRGVDEATIVASGVIPTMPPSRRVKARFLPSSMRSFAMCGHRTSRLKPRRDTSPRSRS